MQSKCKICKAPALMNRNKYKIAHCLSPDCMIAVWELIKQKDKAAKDKAYRAETKKLKESFNAGDTISKWTKKVHAEAFNPYIRYRDRFDPCISCGRTEKEVIKALESTVGGIWDCGHYLSVGSCPELRFDFRNAYKQCKSCNGGSGKYARKNHTVAGEYRERLISIKGIEIVEWLEGLHEMPRYRVEDLKNIHWIYKQLLRIEKK